MATAIIGGSGLLGIDIFKELKKKIIKTDYGRVEVYENKNVVFLQRHTAKHLPPHKINHKANISALKKLKIKEIVGICSVGSLKIKIKPGSIVIPSDYINFDKIVTFYDKKAKHIVPSFDIELRKKIIKKAKKVKIKTLDKGIYLQTTGPRLETKAEINLMKNFADIIGMTVASEATLAKELDLKYVAVCSVDNYANGISKKKISFEQIKTAQKKNSDKIKRLIQAII